jgi:hypothetical protein
LRAGPTKKKVLAKAASMKGSKVENIEPILNRVAGQSFHNTSPLDFQKLKGEPDKIAANLTRYTGRANFEINVGSSWKIRKKTNACYACNQTVGIERNRRIARGKLFIAWKQIIRRTSGAANDWPRSILGIRSTRRVAVSASGIFSSPRRSAFSDINFSRGVFCHLRPCLFVGEQRRHVETRDCVRRLPVFVVAAFFDNELAQPIE